MKSKILVAAFLVSFLLFVPKAKAATTFTDNQVVSSSKAWTINFNDEVVLDDITKNYITVKDGSGNIIPVKLTIDGISGKSIKVNPPSNGYTPGGRYILSIGNYVHSSKGKNIKDAVTMHFSVKNNAVNYKIGDSIKSPEDNEQYEIVDLKTADVNGDSKTEDVILAGMKGEYELYDKFYLIILDPETGVYENYKYIGQEAEKGNTYIHLNDYTGDGVQDIRLNLYPGGNDCDGDPMFFSDKDNELNELNFGMKPFDYGMIGKYLAKMTLSYDNSSYTVDLSKDSSWIDNLNNGWESELYIGYGPSIEDGQDTDGVGIFTTRDLISGAFHADTVASIITTYKYDNNKQKFTIINQQVTSQYPCTKMQSNYLYTDDYKKQNANIAMKIISAYTDASGNRFITGYCYKRLYIDDAIQYQRITGNEINGFYDENGEPYIFDDGCNDVRVSDNFTLQLDDNAKIYTFDFSNVAMKKEISFSKLSSYQYAAPFDVTISNGKALSIAEEYRP